MSFLFSVLASGSAGNAAVLATSTTKLLIDAGVGPRVLSDRLADLGFSIGQLDAVLLTHLHHDHLRPPTLAPFLAQGVNVCCHQNHIRPLARRGGEARKLAEAGLLWGFQEAPFRVGDVEVLPLALPHDDEGGSFGFVFSLPNGARPYRLGHLTDLGHLPSRHLEPLLDLDVLALEHNHDLQLLAESDRPETLKARIRSGFGHLSNCQAACVLWRLLEHSTSPPRHLLLMHLSQECNRPELPLQKSAEVLAAFGAHTEVHLTHQDHSTEPIFLNSRDAS
jgi:phosphoribosyl 1,2-cyclic phosphodiesterase